MTRMRKQREWSHVGFSEEDAQMPLTPKCTCTYVEYTGRETCSSCTTIETENTKKLPNVQLALFAELVCKTKHDIRSTGVRRTFDLVLSQIPNSELTSPILIFSNSEVQRVMSSCGETSSIKSWSFGVTVQLSTAVARVFVCVS